MINDNIIPSPPCNKEVYMANCVCITSLSHSTYMFMSCCRRLVTRRFLGQIVFAYLVCSILPIRLCHVSFIYPAITLMKTKPLFAVSESQFRRFRILAKTMCHPCHVRPSSHWKDFRETWYWGLLWKFVAKIQIWLKSGKNIGNFTWRHVFRRHETAIKSSLTVVFTETMQKGLIVAFLRQQ